jgi:predicted nuclease with RNAse H fold
LGTPLTPEPQHRFVSGGRYRNNNGNYTVLSVDFPQMRVRYDTGVVALLDVLTQERIQQRLAAPPPPIAPTNHRPSSVASPASPPAGARTALVAPETITEHRLDARRVPGGPSDEQPSADNTAGVRIIAIDWSGDATAARRKIWLAEVAGGQLVRLENGRDQEQVTRHLITLARQNERLVVGLDFAFSLPAWFLREQRCASTAELWNLATRDAEGWLARCQHPFWGRPGVGRPNNIPEHFRRTDSEVPRISGISPKSVFQIGGAGAVGTGSLRGMKLLRQLHAAGFSIWPFDPSGWPKVVEIYPRALTGAVVKSSVGDRTAYLARRYPELSGRVREQAALSEDAFDAAVSALVMAAHAQSLVNLVPTADPLLALEGRIWLP